MKCLQKPVFSFFLFFKKRIVLLCSTFADFIMVPNDWPLSKFNSLRRKTQHACVVTLRVSRGHGQRLAELTFFSKLGSNVELEVKKKERSMMFSSPPTNPLPLYIIWTWESKKREEGPVGSWERKANGSPEHFELERWSEKTRIPQKNDCLLIPGPKLAQLEHRFGGNKLRKDTIYYMLIQIQSRTSQDVWSSSSPRYTKSAEGPPCAGLPQNVQNQEAREWRTWMFKESQRRSYWFALWSTFFHSPRGFSFQSWLLCDTKENFPLTEGGKVKSPQGC